MEQLNRVELRGYVGAVRTTKVGNTDIVRFTVATTSVYRSNDGCIVEEVTWHNVTAYGSVECEDLTRLQKGCGISVVGRLRNIRYVTADGSERSMNEIVVGSLKILET